MTRKFRARFPSGTLLKEVIPHHKRYEGRIPSAFVKALPLEIKRVTSHGKKTIIWLTNDWTLFVSYSMTGHWELEKGKYTHVELVFNTGSYFWTCSRPLPTCSIEFQSYNKTKEQLQKSGFDIIHDRPTPEQVLATFKGLRQNVCSFLLNQSKFCGIGNYIKCVVLYRCGINPHTSVNKLTDDQKCKLWSTAKEIAFEAVNAGGMGIRDYKDENGVKVGVSFDITPYSMKEDSKGREVKREIIGGRVTYWVPDQ